MPNTTIAIAIMLGSFVVFRQLYLLVNSLLGNSLVGMSLAYPMGWVMCSLLMTVCYLRSALCRKPKSPAEPAA